MSDVDTQWKATEDALRRAVLLVIVPGMLFAFGLIYVLSPSRAPLSVVNGCYKIDSGPLIKISPPFMDVVSSNLAKRTIIVQYGKPGFQIVVDNGISFTRNIKSQIIAKDESYTNTLIGVTAARKKPLTLSLLIDNNIVYVPKVDCYSRKMAGPSAN